jgi:dihydrofolate synthase/folylpolyglutamate synthase
MIFAMLESKDPDGYLAPFAKLKPRLHTLPVDGHACFPADALATIAGRHGIHAFAAESAAAAMAAVAAESAGRMPPPRILICGSLYLAGGVLAENG